MRAGSLVAGLLALALAAPAWAQDVPVEADSPEIEAPGRLPMLGLARAELYVDGRIAFLKAELKLTEAQEPLFAPVETAMRQGAEARAALPRSGRRSGLANRLAQRQAVLAAELEALKQLNVALGPFYASLSLAQKARADALHDLLP
ncbi:Spy/CpxP family protein refolding chaperone [Zavarzinia sp. CC-PAN008]|uniref:Spy/CpxP family protein refolding chaperone n=1 Tax=Zavarzinia sp. CC-PAN008 TaxID=3243332 RepID=UPI003F748595